MEDGFGDFWNVYPRRVEKIAARKAYDKALKMTTAFIILEAAKKYANERRGQEMKFTKHPARWLNAGCWSDYEAPETCQQVIDGSSVYVRFEERDAWDAYGRSHGKTYPRDSRGGWWFPSKNPPASEVAA